MTVKDFWHRLLDSVLFPARALFIPTESRFGLSSLRDERFRVVAGHCRGRVLDVGCGPGNLFIDRWIGMDRGVGIDVFHYAGVTQVVEDPTQLPFSDASFDTVTLIAVGGHMPKSARVAEFAELVRVLRQGGRLVMTEGEPLTQMLGHLWRRWSLHAVGRIDMDDERGMADDEQYAMSHDEIRLYLNSDPLKLVKHERFMWGLNNVFVAERSL